MFKEKRTCHLEKLGVQKYRTGGLLSTSMKMGKMFSTDGIALYRLLWAWHNLCSPSYCPAGGELYSSWKPFVMAGKLHWVAEAAVVWEALDPCLRVPKWSLQNIFNGSLKQGITVCDVTFVQRFVLAHQFSADQKMLFVPEFHCLTQMDNTQSPYPIHLVNVLWTRRVKDFKHTLEGF